jgi:hypothetical protein
VPTRWVRREWRGHYRGQKQIWYLLKMLGQDSDVTLKCDFEKPEFDAWRWHEFWIPLDSVIEFKRGVYQSALDELSRFVFSEDELVRAHRKAAQNFNQAVDQAFEAGLKIANAMLGGDASTAKISQVDQRRSNDSTK